jgi:hypothetical protein
MLRQLKGVADKFDVRFGSKADIEEFGAHQRKTPGQMSRDLFSLD